MSMNLQTDAGTIATNCSIPQISDALNSMKNDDVEFVILEQGELAYLQSARHGDGFVLEVRVEDKGQFAARKFGLPAHSAKPVKQKKWYEFWRSGDVVAATGNSEDYAHSFAEIERAFESYLNGVEMPGHFFWEKLDI